MSGVQTEILLAFWKVHILHHADEAPIAGQDVLKELRRHGYDISPGTLYPLLARMQRLGWLRSKVAAGASRRARREYTITAKGQELLAFLRTQVEELHREVVLGD